MNVGPFRLRRRGDLFTRSAAPLGYLEFAGWMAEGALWVDGWLTSSSQEPLEITVKTGANEHRVRAQRWSYVRPDLSEIPDAVGQFLVLPLEQPDARRINALYIRHGGDWYRWTNRRGKSIHGDLAARLRHKLTTVPEIRQELGSFLERCAGVLPVDGSDPLFREHVATVQGSAEDELVEMATEEGEKPIIEEEETDDLETNGDPYDVVPRPLCVADPTKPMGLAIENVIATGGESFFVNGWIWDLHGVVEKLELVYPGGKRRALLDSVVRVERSDVIEMFRPVYGDRAEGRHGLIGLFETGVPDEDARRYGFRLKGRGGLSLTCGMPPLLTSFHSARSAIFGALPEMRYREDLDLLADPIHRADERLRGWYREQVSVSRSFEHGTSPEKPAISVILPVSERLDLVEHQLAQLADDPGLGDCEVIFALDSSREEGRFERLLFNLERLYRLPLQGIVLSQRSGRTAAINAAAAHARGRLLVLMDSGVYPDRPGWLMGLAELYESGPEIGVVGPKLLYEDQSLRHAGVYFAKGLEPDDLWTNLRFYSGLPRHHPAAEVARRVPAVSGACLMIRRDLFNRLGGLRDGYFDPDYQAADLCMRCAAEGLGSWYQPSVELFHLEGMSESRDWRGNPWIRLYNRWLQSRRWDEQIGATMEAIGTDP